MTYKETKTEQNQTLSNVPLDKWQEFKLECVKEGVTMTKGFLKALTIWQEANNDKES